MTRISTTLPPGLVCYRSTATFKPESVPAALMRAHNTKAGVWGLLRVLRGRVRYCLDGAMPEAAVIASGETAVIEPEARHHIELLDPDSTFLVEFHRAEAAP